MSKKVKTSELYDCNVSYLTEFFENSVYPWEMLPKIKEHIAKLIDSGIEGFSEITNGVLIGKNVKICACSLQMGREEFSELNLELIDSYECFRRFKGVAAANIADKVAVRPIQQIQDKDRRFREIERDRL